MIQNDAELAVEQEALSHIERALESLRERVYPKNPRNFAIYAEAYIDQINLLKAAIDEYLARKENETSATSETSTPPSVPGPTTVP
jgi:hypothetical protein